MGHKITDDKNKRWLLNIDETMMMTRTFLLTQ